MIKNRTLKQGFYYYTPNEAKYDGVILFVENNALYGLNEKTFNWDRFPFPIETFTQERNDISTETFLYLGE